MDDGAIGCDRCDAWYHPSSMCLGLPDHVVQAIAEYGGAGIVFICTNCKISQPSTSTSDNDSINAAAFKQLHQTVKALCKSFTELSEQVKSMTNSAAARPFSISFL